MIIRIDDALLGAFIRECYRFLAQRGRDARIRAYVVRLALLAAQAHARAVKR